MARQWTSKTVTLLAGVAQNALTEDGNRGGFLITTGAVPVWVHFCSTAADGATAAPPSHLIPANTPWGWTDPSCPANRISVLAASDTTISVSWG
jgi:hypothetical protein